MTPARSRLLVLAGFLLVLVPTGLAAYLRVPLPGSQDLDSIRLAWWLMRAAPWAAAVGVALLVVGLAGVVRGTARWWRKALWFLPAAVAAWILWLAHSVMAPSRWFRPAETVVFATGTSEALPPETLVMGVAAGGEAKAYPVRLLAYHHRLPDTLGGEPILVTYCSMCRTGKVFRPEAGGRPLTFDLVGAFRYNSVYADRETGSWWW